MPSHTARVIGKQSKTSSKPHRERCAEQTSSKAGKAPVTQTGRNVSKRQCTQEEEEEKEAAEDVGQMACCGRGCNDQLRRYRFEELDLDDGPFAEDGHLPRILTVWHMLSLYLCVLHWERFDGEQRSNAAPPL